MAPFNFGYDDKLVEDMGRPVQVEADQTCLACGDEYSGRELVKGVCIHCWLYKHYTKKVPLEVRASYERVEIYPAKELDEITIEKKELEL